MGKLFGTDGIRGVANEYPITPDMVLQIGQATAHILKRKKHCSRIVIGKDTRLSGYMIESSLLSGICSMGTDVILVGPVPTPGIAFLTINLDADAGIVISASHNPYKDNGIKIFSKNGYKLSDEEEMQIEELVLSRKLPTLLTDSENLGRVSREEDASGRYIVFLKNSFPKNLDLEGMKIVLDCANGATYKVAPTLFKEMRAEVIALNVSPNGCNINLDCGALYPETLAKKVVETGSNIGLAFDGDGDRLIAVDEKGNIINGDRMIAICAKRLKDENMLKNNTVVTTVMSNLGLSLAFKEMGIKNIATKVGDRYVLEEMIKNDCILGGEDSGHIIFKEYHTTGDGILTALQLLSVMKKEKKSLFELSKIMKTFPQVLINVKVKRKAPLEEIPELKSVISEVEKELADKGRVLVRYSGTQSICRVMLEGPDKDETERLAAKIAEVVKEKLN
ncbi:MAG: phosphoglucosamine mutase [Actinobacteria bacterium RBG_19FT_COMBO_36_27]|nr:MAG: phosphoglucosamine mutase [Actinobacteria bacterium RBG_19FT_COMBO_36_27]